MKRLLASLSLAPLFFASAAYADTLEDALATAYRNNPNLEDARLAVRSARENSTQAYAGYLPSLGLTSTYGVRQGETETVGIFGPATSDYDLEPVTANVTLQQQLYTGGRRDGQVRVARAGIEGARHSLRSTEQDVLLAAVDAYVSVQRDERILRLRVEHVDALTRQLSGARRRLEVGEVSRTDVAQAQTRLAAARASLARAEADLASSRARYELVVGAPPAGLEPVEPPQVPRTLDTAVGEAEARHPDILRAMAERRGAQAQIEVERSALRPQVSVVGRYSHETESSSPTDRNEGASAVAQLQVPLFEGGFARSRMRQGQINVGRAEARMEARRRQIVADVISSWNNLEAGRDIVAAAQEQVAAADQAVDGAERERGLGLRSTLDVLNAEEERRDARIALARAEAEATFASFALLASTGALTVSVLDIKE
ncbi:TolC family outer membrane protein [Terricaulis sp.]|uniref:TolC family outer membrane protein n=1 Tax=Terricaulis sp. TaxID=2768686 RepID=UPI002AC4AF2A|nr:TolC family outer membrane protein [Terricaulis sp.]MDZ4692488.1 TolC family outer membrane protein [Terricaulis sp.]